MFIGLFILLFMDSFFKLIFVFIGTAVVVVVTSVVTASKLGRPCAHINCLAEANRLKFILIFSSL